MEKIIADPLKVQRFDTELRMLGAHLHSHLTVLKAAPSSHALNLFENSIASKIASASYRVCADAYNKAAQDVGVPSSVADLRDLRNETLDWGKRQAKLMADTSSQSLEIQAAMSKMRVASKDRASFASNFQLRTAYFLGTTRGWQLNKKSKKGWLVSSMHDKDDTCDDNQDQGLISVFDFFSSGVMYAPAHISCNCTIYLYLPKDN